MATEQHNDKPPVGDGDGDLVTAPLTDHPKTEHPSTEPAPSLKTRVSSLLAKVSLADDPVRAAEPISPHTVPQIRVPAPAVSPVRRHAPAAAAIFVGLLGVLLVVGTAPVWVRAPVGWRLTIPGLSPGTPGSSLYYGTLFLAGMLLIGAGWLGLLAATSGRSPGRARLKWVIAAVALWATPFLFGPIQLSTDAYSYAAQGYMATQGIDPSANGPNTLPKTPCDEGDSNCYWSASDPIWRSAPAPYGPVGVGIEKIAVIASGENTYWTVHLLRLASLAGVALAAFGIFHIARARKVDPALALGIAIANPVVLVHLIGGAHNDAMMMGLLAVALAAWEKSRKVLAVVLVVLAVCIKLPAVLALAFIAYNWHGENREMPFKERLKAFPIIGAASAALIVGLCLAVGIGLGWLTALSSTGKVYSTFSFFTKLGFITSDLLELVGINTDPLTVTALFRLLGLATAAVIMTVILVRSPKLGVTKSVGFALMTLMLCGPVIWPWYLPVAFALLAAVGVRRFRPTLIVLVVASSLLVWPTTIVQIRALNDYEHWLGLLAVLAIAACCVVAQRLAHVLEQRGRDGMKVPTIEAVLITSATAAPADRAS